MLSTAGGFHIVFIPFSSPKASPAAPPSSAKQSAGSMSSWDANSCAASEDPTPTKNTFPDGVAGRTTSRSCAACSQHKNHPKCLRKATTAVSSATPNGVFCLHSDVNAVGVASDALTRGVVCNPAKILD
uniref:Uncharacterized protein n=1 Tax=Ditylum brightwellii TaxID=49249 RepID=A0A7S1ZI81_9STRA